MLTLDRACGIDAAPEGVRAVLHDVTGWANWVPGLRRAQPDKDLVHLEWGGPHPGEGWFTLVQSEDAVQLTWVHGRAREVRCAARWRPEASGTRLFWSAHLDPLVTWPGSLWRDLELHYPTAFEAALRQRLGA